MKAPQYYVLNTWPVLSMNSHSLGTLKIFRTLQENYSVILCLLLMWQNYISFQKFCIRKFLFINVAYKNNLYIDLTKFLQLRI
jgi:hypothetical protein